MTAFDAFFHTQVSAAATVAAPSASEREDTMVSEGQGRAVWRCEYVSGHSKGDPGGCCSGNSSFEVTTEHNLYALFSLG